MKFKIDLKHIVLTFIFILLISFIHELYINASSSLGIVVMGLILVFFVLIFSLAKASSIQIQLIIIAFFYCLVVSKLSKPFLNHFDLPKKKYTGVYGITYEPTKGIDGDTNESVDWHKTYVYNKKDNELQNELYYLNSKYGEVDTKNFIFWETAVVNGFEPKNNLEYSKKKDNLFKELISINIIIKFILESLINAFFTSLIAMIVPIGWIIFDYNQFDREILKVLKSFKMDLF